MTIHVKIDGPVAVVTSTPGTPRRKGFGPRDFIQFEQDRESKTDVLTVSPETEAKSYAAEWARKVKTDVKITLVPEEGGRDGN